jgi:peptidoglycan/LPS O-acetylase OafA/YrhL
MSIPSHTYRPDVDGLRAVAVLAVLAFHAFPAVAPGGFTGVDVFFVISGFLITGIILDGLSRNRFTFANFYARRVRRIFPALTLTLAASLAVGWQVMLPDEYSELGKHAAAGAGFVSNFSLWREVGYFNRAADVKPLMHLWSLGVEEQYYALWPVLLFLFRARPIAMLWMIVTIGVASFGLNVVTVAEHPSAAFFFPMTRFWELLSGSLLAYFAHYRPQPPQFVNVKAWTGIALVAAGFALLDGTRAFPGWWAIAPVLGTTLLISAGPRAWLNRTILSHRAIVYVGLISYPLYLWHWPVLVFVRIAHGSEPPAAMRIAALIASGIFAWATYEFVERQIRVATSDTWIRRRALPTLAISTAAIGLVGLVVFHTLLTPRSARLPRVDEISRARGDWEAGGDRVVPGDTRRAVVFFGDSHMQQYWPRIQKLVIEHRAPLRTVVFKTRNGCAPVPGIERLNVRCARFVDEGLRLARAPEVDTVVIAASWVGLINLSDYYRVGDPSRTPLDLLDPDTSWVFDGFEDALREIAARGTRVVIVLSSPRGKAFDPMSRIERGDLTVQVRDGASAVSRGELRAQAAPVDERLRRIAQAVGAVLVDPADWLCTPLLCPTTDELGRPLYKDASHLRASAARERFGAVDEFVVWR